MDNSDRASFASDLGGQLLHSDEEVRKQANKFEKIQAGVVQVLHRISITKITSKTWLFFLLLVDALQLVFLSVGTQASLPWVRSGVMMQIFTPYTFCIFMPSATLTPGLTNLYPAQWLFLGACIWTTVMIGTAVMCVLSEIEYITIKSTWAFRILAAMVHISIYALPVPLLSSLLAAFDSTQRYANTTPSQWLDSGIAANSGGHIPILAVAAFLSPLLFLFLGAVAWLAIDRIPANPSARKRNLVAAASGRFLLGGLIIKLVLVLTWVFARGINGYGYTLIVAAAAAAMFSLYYIYLPYFATSVNQFYTAMAAVMLAGCVSTLIGLSSPDNDVCTLVFVVVAPVAAYAGYSAVETRMKRLSQVVKQHSDATLATSPHAVELVIRTMLYDALIEDASGQANSSDNVGGQKINKKTAEDVSGLMFSENEDGFYTVIVPPHRATDATELLHKRHPVVQKMFQLLQSARAALPSSAALDVIIANFAKYGLRNRHLERIYLRAAEAKAEKSALDIHLFVAFRLREMALEEEASAGSKMSVTKRMEFETLLQESNTVLLRGHVALSHFWTSLQDKAPNLSKLQSIGNIISTTISEGHHIYEQLLKMAPQSIAVMRAYAAFLLRLANDPKKAAVFLSDAEQTEDEQSRFRLQTSDVADVLLGSMMPEFDLSIDNTSILRVSAQVGSMGIITDANSSALKMVGYTKREVVGKDINVVVPEPISRVHPMLLENYTRHGNEVIINTCRVYFIQHHAGYIFPARVHIRPMADEWAAIMEELNTPQAFIWFTGAPSSWKVTAACKSAYSALNLDLVAIKSGNISMLDIAPDLIEMLPYFTNYNSVVRMDLHSMDKARSGFSAAKVVAVSAKMQKVRVGALEDTIYILRYIPAPKGSHGPMSPAASTRARGLSQNPRSASKGPGENRHNPSFSVQIPDSHYAGDIQLCPVMSKRLASEPKMALSPTNVAGSLLSIGTGDPGANSTSRGLAHQGGIESDGEHSSIHNPHENVISETEHEDSSEDEKKSFDATESPRFQPPLESKPAPNAVRFVGFKDASSSGADSDENASVGSDSPLKPKTKRTMRGTPRGKGIDTPQANFNHRPELDIQESASPTGQETKQKPVGLNASSPFRAKSPLYSPPLIAAPSVDARRSRADSVDGQGVHVAPGSVHSKGSGTSSATMSEVLRRGVHAKNGQVDPSLKRLKWAIKIIFTIVCMLSIVAVIIDSTLFGQLSENMKLVGMNGDRGRYMQAAYAAALRMTLAVEGKFELAREGYNGTDARMRYNLAKFEELHHKLYLAVDGKLTAETDLYTKDQVPIIDLVPGSYVSRGTYTGKARSINLANAGLEFISKGRQMLDLPIAERTMDHPIVFWVNENGWRGVRDSVNASIMMSFERSSTQADVIQSANVIILCTVCGLLALIGLSVMLPAISYVTKSTQRVFDVFLHVPVPLVKALRQESMMQLQQLQKAEDGVDNEADGEVMMAADGEAAPVMEAGSALRMALNTYQNKNRGKNPDPDSVHDGTHDDDDDSARVVVRVNTGDRNLMQQHPRSAGCCKCGRESSHTTGRRFRNEASNQLSMLFTVFWPVALVLAYFIGTYFWKQSVVQLARHAKAESLWSKQVQFYVPQALYAPRMASAYCDYNFSSYAIARSRRAIDFMDRLQDGLLFGDSRRDLRAGLQQSEAITRLFMSDACVENGGLFYDMEECMSTFMNGFLHKVGLRAALTEYLQLVKNFLNDREVQLASPNCTYMSMNSGAPGRISDLGDYFLAPAFDLASRTFNDAGHDALQAFVSLDLALTILLILSLILLYWVFYLRTVLHLDLQMRRSRELLLVFPDEVARAVPSIIQAGRDMLSTSNTSGKAR